MLAVFDRPRISSDKGVAELTSPERRNVPAKFSALFGDGHVPFHAVVHSISPGHALAQFALDHGFDLIVVGKPSTAVARDSDDTACTLAAISATPILIAAAGNDGSGPAIGSLAAGGKN